MKYFLDTEFNEYHKQVKVAGIKVDKAIPTIDLISIGIVSENNREYYAISKDFNLKDAWYDNQRTKENHNHWLRDNVLIPIIIELLNKELFEDISREEPSFYNDSNILIKNDINTITITLSLLKRLINKYGKTKKQIAEEIKEFIYTNERIRKPDSPDKNVGYLFPSSSNIEFYAYYADYDWVVFAQLFGTMMNLPTGFPMYCFDLKQELDTEVYKRAEGIAVQSGSKQVDIENMLLVIKEHSKYPKQKNEHNALADAKWNKELYKFLKEL